MVFSKETGSQDVGQCVGRRLPLYLSPCGSCRGCVHSKDRNHSSVNFAIRTSFEGDIRVKYDAKDAKMTSDRAERYLTSCLGSTFAGPLVFPLLGFLLFGCFDLQALLDERKPLYLVNLPYAKWHHKRSCSLRPLWHAWP